MNAGMSLKPTAGPYGAPSFARDLEDAAARIGRSGAPAGAQLAALARLASRWSDDAVAVGWFMRQARRVSAKEVMWPDARRLVLAARSRRRGVAA